MARLGLPPMRYYQLIRLARARDLSANTNLSKQEIALRCGFSTTSGLWRALRRNAPLIELPAGRPPAGSRRRRARG